MRPEIIYVCVLSVVAAVVTIWDKCAASCGARRVPEATLLTLAVLGGSGAMYLVMLLIRHKTLHKRFMLGLPAILILQIVALLLVKSYVL